MEKECKVIMNMTLCKYLLRNGGLIVDVKPHKKNPLRTVFVFLNTVKLREDMKNYDYDAYKSSLTK